MELKGEIIGIDYEKDLFRVRTYSGEVVEVTRELAYDLLAQAEKRRAIAQWNSLPWWKKLFISHPSL